MTAEQKLYRFEEQISPHLNSAYNLARWLTRNHEDAEDVVQEAFLRAFSALDNLRSADAKSWLLTIVRNCALTWVQRNRNSAAMAELDQHFVEPSEPSPDPEEMLLISFDGEQVEQALDQLPAEFREMIVLRELEGLSYKEIAATVGVPMGTVMWRLSRGREWLRRALSITRKESVR